MKWDDQSIAEKRNVINCVDLVFTASENPEAYNAARTKLKESNVESALLDCSDAHSFSSSQDKDRIGNCFTWIKADPTFEGLRHAVAEFDQRVFVGDMPPKRLLVESNRTKYVSSIKIKKKAGSILPDTWFDVDVPLNHDLVAVIGNKGSGKSALTDVAALIGDTKNYDSFSFLTDGRFRDPRNNLASHFVGSLRWYDETDSHKELHDTPSPSSVERIKYLPQSYLETLCNELAGSGSSTFDSELRKIIFTHVPEEERMGFLSLDDLLAFKVSELEAERKQLVQDLSKLNADIVTVERKLSPAFRQSLNQQLENKKQELSALKRAAPIAVDDPLTSDAARQEAEAATKLAELEGKLNAVRSEEQAVRQKKAEALKGIAHVNRTLQAVKNHQKVYDQFVAELKVMLTEVDAVLTVGGVVSLNVDISPIEKYGVIFRQNLEIQEAQLSGREDGGLIRRREFIEAEIKTIKSQLGEKQRLFLVYKEQLAQWKNRRRSCKVIKTKVIPSRGIWRKFRRLKRFLPSAISYEPIVLPLSGAYMNR